VLEILEMRQAGIRHVSRWQNQLAQVFKMLDMFQACIAVPLVGLQQTLELT
jgi:hypothetical protein